MKDGAAFLCVLQGLSVICTASVLTSSAVTPTTEAGPAQQTTSTTSNGTLIANQFSPKVTPQDWNGLNATVTSSATSMTTSEPRLPVTLPDIGVVGGILPLDPVSWMKEWRFHCERPTTPCDGMMGFCDYNTGLCSCFSQAFGLQCQAPNGAMQNSGVCLISNPCQRGVCYDDGVSAKCSCPDGYYGDWCQHKMMIAECTKQKMVVNIYPYGFSDAAWDYIPAPKTETCTLDRMAAFLANSSGYENKGWRGFAKEFLHKADPCAGDATSELSSTGNSTIYSRKIQVFYGGGRHPTDTEVNVTCEVPLNEAPPVSVGLPAPQVNVQVMDDVRGARITGPVKLGSLVVVQFSVNTHNNANIDDLRVETCIVSDGRDSQKIIVVDHGCSVPPMGKKLFSPQHGTQYLSVLMHSFPGTSQLEFQCRVRLCDSLKQDACAAVRQCFRRRKRTAEETRRHDDSVIAVDFQF